MLSPQGWQLSTVRTMPESGDLEVRMKPTENSGDDPGPGAPTLQRAISTVSTVRLVTVAPTFLLGALALQMRADLDFSQAKLGIAAASLRGVVALTSTTLGRVVDLAGPSRTMRIGALVTAFAALGIALFANSWEALVGWLVLGGVASALSGAGDQRLHRPSRSGRPAWPRFRISAVCSPGGCSRGRVRAAPRSANGRMAVGVRGTCGCSHTRNTSRSLRRLERTAPAR